MSLFARMVFLNTLFTVVILLVANPSWVSDELEKEYESTSALLGSQRATEIAVLAGSWYRVVAEDYGTQAATHRIFGSRNDLLSDSSSLEVFRRWMSTRAETLWWLVYQMLYRTALSAHWLIYITPILVASAVDGWHRRKIKQALFEYTSPVKNDAAYWGAIGSVVWFWIYLTVPVYVPPIFPLFWAVFLAILIVTFVSNIQKRL